MQIYQKQKKWLDMNQKYLFNKELNILLNGIKIIITNNDYNTKYKILIKNK